MRKLILATVGVFGLAHAAMADVVSIDFTKLASGTGVTTQYSDVVFSLAGGNATGSPTISSYGTGLSNSPTAGKYPTAEELIAKFADPVTDVSFEFNNEGFNGKNNYELLDASGAVLKSGLLSGYTYDLSSIQNVSEIIWSNGLATGQGNWTQGLSTITYTPVPEPASLALLGAGLLGVGMIQRRRA